MSDLIDRQGSDLIDRQAAIDALDSINCCGWVEDSWAKVSGIIEHVPSAQRTGRWELIDEAEPRRYGCSNCKRLSWYQYNFCPNCGARMEEVGKDE